MQRRKFSIFVYKDVDWELGLEEVDNFESYPPLGGADYEFGMSAGTKDKKIAYLFDTVVSDEDLERAKDDERFKEICDFKTKKIHNNDTRTNDAFTGSFIDALAFIKKTLQDE